MTDSHFEKIRTHVFERSRLFFSGNKKHQLRQRLEHRLAQLNLPDFSAYWDYLQRTPEEEPRLFDALTTNETFFFRNSAQFRFLKEKILPQIETQRGLDVVRSWGEDRSTPASEIMKIRILSAGCSTGEEPYSLAMTVMDGLRYPKAWNVEIIAGDLSESCLDVARTGYYEKERLKGIPPDYEERYLSDAPGGATVRDDLKEMVTFVNLNLNDLLSDKDIPGLYSEGFDIIFCRNVMIYFSSPCQQLLIDALHRLLVPGGYLFTGDAEPLHLFKHDFAAVTSAGCLIYQKETETRNA